MPILVTALFIMCAGMLLILLKQQQKINVFRKQLENLELLRRSEKEKIIYGNAMEQALNEIYIFNAETFKFIIVNKGGRENTGYSIEELRNMTPVDLNSEFTEEQLRRLIEPLVDGEEDITQFYTDFMRKNGSVYPVEVHLSVNRDEKLFVATVIDITGSKQVLQSLEENILLFQTLVDTIPDLVWLKDLDGVYLFCNPNIERLFGAKVAGIIGKTDYDFVDKELADSFRDNDKKALAAGRPRVNEEWVTFADDGHEALLETIKTPMSDKRGNFIGILGIARDITERKKSEEVIRNSEVRFRKLHESMIDAFVQVDMNGKIVSYNSTYKELLGYTCDELEHLTYKELTPEKWHGFETDIVKNQILINGFSEIYEKEYIRKDGTVIPVELRTSLLTDNSGNPTGMWAIVRDISERKHSEKKIMDLLSNIEEEKNRLTSLINSISDEIWFADTNGKFILANPIALKRFCIDSNQMIEVEKFAKSLTVLRPDGIIRPVDEAPPLRALSGEVVTNQEEIVLIPETNEYRNRQVNASPVKDSNGRIIGSVSVVRDITEIKSALKSIEKSAQEWRATFDSISDIIWLLDTDCRIIRANAATERVLDITPVEIIGKYCWNILHGTDGPVDGCPLLKLQKTLKPETSVMMIKKRWFRITVYPILNDDGVLTGIVDAIHDITAEKKAEEELSLRSTAMENAANAIMITDIEGTIVWINTAFEKMTQYNASEVIGFNPRDILKSDKNNSEYYKELWETIKSGRVWKGEIINKRKDGSFYTEEMTIAPVKNAEGEILNYIAIKQDITDKKFAESLLNARMELFDFSDDHTLEEILIKTLDEVERFTFSTISFFHFLEEDQKTISLQEWSTATSNKFCKTEGKGTHYSVDDAGVWADCIREKGPVIHNDYMSLPNRRGLPEGHAPVIREMVIPIMRDHKIKAILGVGNKSGDYTKSDISITNYFADIAWNIIERKRTLNYLKQFNRELELRVAERTAQLEKANKELDSFSYSVSHDLRSPLRHITGFLEMFRMETGDIPNEKAKHYMDVIDESAKRMGQLIDDLLSFSRMGRASLSSNLVNMNYLVNDILEDFSDDIQGDKISVIRHPLPDIKGDRAMLRVVYVNLISNAVKFSKKSLNPEIIIGHEIINGEDTFFIRDNGVGFNMQYASKLFGVFQRLHNERDFSGTGIGLAMVKNIIERHNGRIWAESEPDKGACFYFVLPGSETESPANKTGLEK